MVLLILQEQDEQPHIQHAQQAVPGCVTTPAKCHLVGAMLTDSKQL
jgi:hypothetical protein